MNEPRTLAESAAREQFIIESGGSDLGNYTVRITELADAFEVVFVPNQPPMIKDRSGEVVVILGGQTIYGKEVHYLIEKNTYHVARRTFGR